MGREASPMGNDASLRPMLAMLARYNAWANRVMFEAVAALPEGEAIRPRTSLFRNMVHTLNHNYVIGLIWQAHLQQPALRHRSWRYFSLSDSGASLSLSLNTFLNLSTFGRMTTAQYCCAGFRLK